jgi:hypothetical protein
MGSVTRVIVDNISEKEDFARDRFLDITVPSNTAAVPGMGRILFDDVHRHKVFVHGIYVTSFSRLNFGVDLDDGDVGRDRESMPEASTMSSVSMMWTKAVVEEEKKHSYRMPIALGQQYFDMLFEEPLPGGCRIVCFPSFIVFRAVQPNAMIAMIKH